MQSKTQLAPKQAPSGTQQLAVIAKKYYLPLDIQFEKDVIVVTYRDSIKQLLYHGSGYILHRSKYELFEMNGKVFKNPPKLLKFMV